MSGSFAVVGRGIWSGMTAGHTALLQPCSQAEHVTPGIGRPITRTRDVPHHGGKGDTARGTEGGDNSDPEVHVVPPALGVTGNSLCPSRASRRAFSAGVKPAGGGQRAGPAAALGPSSPRTR
jgi:hypothetical protein